MRSKKGHLRGATIRGAPVRYPPRSGLLSAMGLDCALSEAHNSLVRNVLLGHPRGPKRTPFPGRRHRETSLRKRGAP
jgi:hypothetical protein